MPLIRTIFLTVLATMLIFAAGCRRAKSSESKIVDSSFNNNQKAARQIVDRRNQYDGRWWLSIESGQRNGFVYGYVTCYSELVNREFFDGIPPRSDAALTEHFQKHPDSLSQLVDTTLIELARQYPKSSVASSEPGEESAEELAAKWGANNDGGEWRAPDDFNLGYVEGFLECNSRRTRQKFGSYSRPPEWYVKAIADWYGTGDDPEKINHDREREKIPEVLFRFRDEAPKQ